MEADFATLDNERSLRLAELLADAHHGAIPIRERFLQTRGAPPEPGPLSEIVRNRHHTALDTYLLIVAATAVPPHGLYVSPDYWASLIRKPNQSIRNARLALYRSLDVLDDLNLIWQETRLGVPRYRLLDESGNGYAYVHPAKRDERYLTIPRAYWEMGLDRTLDLPGKAVLLIVRSLKRYFTLPLANAMKWYGVSEDTLRRGMSELVQAKVVRYASKDVPSARAPRGTTVRRTYTLVGRMELDRVSEGRAVERP